MRAQLEEIVWVLALGAAVATLELDMPFTVALPLGALVSLTDTSGLLPAFTSERAPHQRSRCTFATRAAT